MLGKTQESSPPVFNKASTFSSSTLTGQQSSNSFQGRHSLHSASSSTSGMSDDLQGLLIPGRNVILRFESMPAAELKVMSLKSGHDP